MSKRTISPAPILHKEILDRFHNGINKTPGQGPNGDCWQWTKCVNSMGYGQLRAPRSTGGKKAYLVHRIAFYLATGEWPSRLVLHSCDNPPCCRPDHLSQGNETENANQMVARGRGTTGANNVHTTHPEKIKRGEQRRGTKLTDDKVRAIREAHACGSSTQRALAAQHGVGQSCVSAVIHRRTWTHI